MQGGWPKHLDIYDLPLRKVYEAAGERVPSVPKNTPFFPAQEGFNTLSLYVRPQYNIGGHYESIRPLSEQLDVIKCGLEGCKESKLKWLEVAFKDTQHYTPKVYSKK